MAAERFLRLARLGTAEFWTGADTVLARRLWHDHQLRRRQLRVVKRPVADVMIAAFASRFQGVITRNASDFQTISASLVIVEP